MKEHVIPFPFPDEERKSSISLAYRCDGYENIRIVAFISYRGHIVDLHVETKLLLHTAHIR